MRKLFATALVALLLGVGIVAVIETDPGYVLVSYANYTLKASLWVGLLLLLLSVLSIYLLLQLAYRIVGGRRSLVSWLGTRKTRNALRLTTRGLISFTEGNWQTARRQLLRGAQHNEVPLLNYLLAARASAQLHDTAEVQEYLHTAGEHDPGATVAAAGTAFVVRALSGRSPPGEEVVAWLRANTIPLVSTEPGSMKTQATM